MVTENDSFPQKNGSVDTNIGPGPVRFLFDRMLGGLCREMRMLGIDCELARERRSP